MVKKTVSLLLICLLGLGAWSKDVNTERAQQVAKNYLYLESGIAGKTSYENIQLQLAKVEVREMDTTYFVFSLQNQEGFVLVAADDRAFPILGYSLETAFSEDQAPGLVELLNQYSEQLALIKRRGVSARSDAPSIWERYEQAIGKTTPVFDPAEPLLLTHWGQRWPYNELCPVDTDGPGGHALVGCVAISIAQVMKYYGWPAEGTGTHSYYDYDYGNQTANFGTASYVHDNMPLQASESNLNLAQFLYHCGVAAEMNYGVDGSGAWVSTACEGMVDYFSYSANYEYNNRNNYSDSQWKAMIKAEIDAKRPTVYVGYDDDGGHAWNCDAYQNDHFHMNWGWSGSNDGYFLLDQLVPGSYNFYSGHKVAIKLYPEATFSTNCGNVQTISGNEGSFHDGSAHENYANNTDCYYEIMPDCGQQIDLRFEMLHLGSGDSIMVYDAVDSSGELVGVLNQFSGLETFETSKGSMLLHFVCDGDTTGNGFAVSYEVKSCSGTRVYTQGSGSISDGSGSCDYSNSRLCFWKIESPQAESITLDFTSFDLAEDLDNVKIYEGDNTGTMIAKYKYNQLPSGPLTIDGNEVTIYFFTNSEGTAGGWSLDYSSFINPNNIEETSSKAIKLYPVPVKDLLICEWNWISEEASNVKLINQVGEVVEVIDAQGTNRLELTTSHLPAGVYYLQMSSVKDRMVQRFIKI